MNLDSLLSTVSGLHFTHVYDSWHYLAQKSHDSALDLISLNTKYDLDGYSSIIFAGMGGSATAGEIAASLLNGSKVKCSVLKGSSLADNVDRDALVIASSVSGNTYETIQVAKSCLKRGIDVITLSSGGELRQLSVNNKIFHVHVSDLGAPRVSLPGLLYPMLNILKNIEPDIEYQIRSSLKQLASLSQVVNTSVPFDKNPAKQLASFLLDYFPICYYTPLMKAAGIRFKNSLNENSKMQVICDDIEEACHNGIVPFSYEKADHYRLVFLRSPVDETMLARRFDVLKDFLTGKDFKITEIYAYGDTLLANLLCAIYLFDFASIYLALMKGRDPAPTSAIDFVKRGLAKF